MKAKYGPVPVPVEPVAPLTVTFETAQEISDFRWLIGHDVTIPDAISSRQAGGREDIRKKAFDLLRALQRTVCEATKS